MNPDQYRISKLASEEKADAFPALLVPKAPAFRSLGVGNTKGHELVAAGHLTMVKIGTKSLITAESLRHFVASLTPVRTLADR
jgi:hypothetical protein